MNNTDIDTTRPYRVYPRDEKGNLVCDGYLDAFFYNPWLSSAVGFEHLLRDAGVFGKRIQDAWDPNREDPQLVSIGTDGESYGHHEPFGDMCAAYLYNRFAPENNMVPVNYGWYLEKFPPKAPGAAPTGWAAGTVTADAPPAAAPTGTRNGAAPSVTPLTT